MLDKQKILAESIPYLIDRLTNPSCVDSSGEPSANQPATADLDCPTGFEREFAPLVDINIGIIDSSLGANGADSCSTSDPGRNNDDLGHLVARGSSNPQTYQGQGFLAWDPSNQRNGTTSAAALTSTLQDLVSGTGQLGCGYEHQLESVTRFLVDPNPYAQLVKGSGGLAPVTPSGTDNVILQQRQDFLRSDSLLAIIMLTDENDCSINTDNQQAYAVLDTAPFFRASSTCSTDPNNTCCYSCGLASPSGCASDPVCNNPKLSPTEDSVNLRCWNQKKRYGFDALFPVQRYVTAFSQSKIDPTVPTLVDHGGSDTVVNPLFSDLSGTGKPVRDSGLVFFMGIVGVPYQAVAKNPADLGQGLKTFADLDQSGFFTQYVGDPDSHVEPTAPIMVEDDKKRGPVSSDPNGGDRTISNADDLQYACIYPLAAPQPAGSSCQNGASADNPLCTAGGEPQIADKAYPSLRELAVLHGLGQQGIAASICPQNVSDAMKSNYAYQPAISALVERMKSRLKK